MIYLAYCTCTTTTLFARLRGWPQQRSAFSLGRFGFIVNLLAVLWGVAMIVNLSWYRPVATAPFYLNAAIYIFVPIILIVGAIYYYGFQKRRNANAPASAPSA
ncbi:MAG: hypothetical protein ABI068_10190 [Ktedonobacterales bacterium]